MIALFISLYVLSEPFVLLNGRWEGIAFLGSLGWSKHLDSFIGNSVVYELKFWYFISTLISLKHKNYLPLFFNLAVQYSNFTIIKILYYYLYYVFSVYQIYKITYTNFLIEI